MLYINYLPKFQLLLRVVSDYIGLKSTALRYFQYFTLLTTDVHQIYF